MSDAIQSYRKKPLVVRAIQWDEKSKTIVRLWNEGVQLRWSPGDYVTELFNPGSDRWLQVDLGDYIILAPTGCRYPVKADQFERNYEELAGSETE